MNNKTYAQFKQIYSCLLEAGIIVKISLVNQEGKFNEGDFLKEELKRIIKGVQSDTVNIGRRFSQVKERLKADDKHWVSLEFFFTKTSPDRTGNKKTVGWATPLNVFGSEYRIWVKEGYQTFRKVLRHELRHIYQYMNGLVEKSSQYLPYQERPHEKDADLYADLWECSVKELRNICKNKGIKRYSKLRKKELIELIIDYATRTSKRGIKR